MENPSTAIQYRALFIVARELGYDLDCMTVVFEFIEGTGSLLARVALGKESCIGVIAIGSTNCDSRLGVNISHSSKFSRLVFGGISDNAQSIDPEIFD